MDTIEERVAVAGSAVVAVLTYKRNDDLAVLLPRLVEQAASLGSSWSVRVLIVDNDPQAGAEPIVRLACERGRDPLEYVHEPEPGISAARNRALRECARDDMLVFLDDDERPSDGWLRLLLATYVSHGRPAAVIGPVVSTFVVEPDPWVRAGEFFTRRRMPTGSLVAVGATNNLLLDLKQVRDHGLSFDAKSGLTGGEDTLFTRELFRAGGRMVWCDEAVVHDIVPIERLTRSWVLQRALSSGNSWSVTEVRLAGTFTVRCATRVHLSLAGVARVAVGGARAAAGAVMRSPRHQAKGTRTIARGVGMLSGAWGLRYHEYKRKGPVLASGSAR